jgi:hypothetical protein
VVLVAGGGVLAVAGATGADVVGVAAVVGAGLLLMVTGVAVDFDLWVAAFLLCVVDFLCVVTAAGFALAACLVVWPLVLADPPQAASATAAAIAVAIVRFI